MDSLPRIVWTLWLQGWDAAPETARACLASWRR
ncbi:MAG: capsular polysaccharide synthesis protein, partial [Vitreimonas sp.]